MVNRSMMRILVLASALCVIGLTARAEPMPCVPLTALETWQAKTGESPVGRGMMVGTYPAALYAKEGGTWTLFILVMDKQIACVRAIGDGWTPVEPPPPKRRVS